MEVWHEKIYQLTQTVVSSHDDIDPWIQSIWKGIEESSCILNDEEYLVIFAQWLYQVQDENKIDQSDPLISLTKQALLYDHPQLHQFLYYANCLHSLQQHQWTIRENDIQSAFSNAYSMLKVVSQMIFSPPSLHTPTNSIQIGNQLSSRIAKKKKVALLLKKAQRHRRRPVLEVQPNIEEEKVEGGLEKAQKVRYKTHGGKWKMNEKVYDNLSSYGGCTESFMFLSETGWSCCGNTAQDSVCTRSFLKKKKKLKKDLK